MINLTCYISPMYKKLFPGSLFLAFAFPVMVHSSSYSQPLNRKKLDSLFDVLQNRQLATGGAAITAGS